MDDFERQWAVALKKSQVQQTTKIVPIDVWKKQVEEEMNYFKEELKKYIAVKNEGKIKGILEKLFALRAEQIKIFSEELMKKFGFINENKIETEVKKYLADCQKLVQTTQKLTNK